MIAVETINNRLETRYICFFSHTPSRVAYRVQCTQHTRRLFPTGKLYCYYIDTVHTALNAGTSGRREKMPHDIIMTFRTRIYCPCRTAADVSILIIV